MVFRSNVQDDWRRLGEIDPYYGVLSAEQFHAETITDDAKREFFRSGVVHVERCLEVLQRAFGFRPNGGALDFGCGVGRLTSAMAPFFSEVVGLDISPGMLSEARVEAAKRGLSNVTFDLSTQHHLLAPERYDFVHSYLVLQHIPVPSGEQIIRDMIAALKPGGIGAIHVTYGKSTGILRARLRAFVKDILVLRYLGNTLLGRPWNYPTMQMNWYSVERILNMLGESKIEQLFLHRVDDMGHGGVFFFFQKPQGRELMSPWSNPVPGS